MTVTPTWLPEHVRPIKVSCAVIIHTFDVPRVLMAQRKPGVDFAFLWEFPGGKVKPGETYQAAACREVREELGCRVKSAEMTTRWEAYEQTSDGREVHCAFRLVVLETLPESYLPFPFEPEAAIGIGWFSADELLLVKHTPAGVTVAPDIAKHLQLLSYLEAK